MIRRLLLAAGVCTLLASAQGPSGKLRVLAIGAHPDDCDIKFGGTAIQLARAGHAVKFLSITNGDAGHQTLGGAALAKRRHAEAQEAARRFGIAEYQILDNHDGELMPTLEARRQVIRAIRPWKADLVIAPRANDYHPDHRYTGILVQDAAYMVVVPNIVPDTPPLERNPIFLYYRDNFEKPAPFRPDIVVPIDRVIEVKLRALDSHVSQFGEWLPWVDGAAATLPLDAAGRRAFLERRYTQSVSNAMRDTLRQELGEAKAAAVRTAEAFELCEYGRRPAIEELRKLFPIE